MTPWKELEQTPWGSHRMTVAFCVVFNSISMPAGRQVCPCWPSYTRDRVNSFQPNWCWDSHACNWTVSTCISGQVLYNSPGGSLLPAETAPSSLSCSLTYLTDSPSLRETAEYRAELQTACLGEPGLCMLKSQLAVFSRPLSPTRLWLLGRPAYPFKTPSSVSGI